jgi:hypothetical protein
MDLSTMISKMLTLALVDDPKRSYVYDSKARDYRDGRILYKGYILPKLTAHLHVYTHLEHFTVYSISYKRSLDAFIVTLDAEQNGQGLWVTFRVNVKEGKVTWVERVYESKSESLRDYLEELPPKWSRGCIQIYHGK